MIISPQSLDTNLSQLLAEVKSGSMQLPEFQRDWTWDDNRIRGIIASLSQGYPMGAIMRLQYGNPDIQFKYRTITGVKGVSVKPEHLILDGQQRLTSIYQATSSKEPVSTKTEKGKTNETRYAYDIEDMVEEVNGRPNAMHTINSAVFSSTRLLTLQTRLSAAYKGIMALLYKEKCRDFMNNTTIDIVNSMLESPDIHHIFPEAYCEKMGIKRERYNSIIIVGEIGTLAE